jgi:hypothetical protein
MLVAAPATGSGRDHHRSGGRLKLLAAHDRQSHRKNVGQGLHQLLRSGAPQENDQRVGMSSLRMNAIGKAFNRGGDN